MESEDGVGRKQERGGGQTIWGGQESANSTKRKDRKDKSQRAQTGCNCS